jgi:hypothetical protein
MINHPWVKPVSDELNLADLPVQLSLRSWTTNRGQLKDELTPRRSLEETSEFNLAISDTDYYCDSAYVFLPQFDRY